MTRRLAIVALGVGLALASCTETTTPPGVGPPAVASGVLGGLAAVPGGDVPLLPVDFSLAAKPRVDFPVMREKLGDPDSLFAYDSKNPFLHKSPLLVTGVRRFRGAEWYRVLLPMKPNGVSAWVRGKDVRLLERHDRIVVDLSERILEHYVGGQLVHSFSVGIGTPSAPTPTGTFYVWVRVRYSSPTGPYGIFALGLSGFSETLSDWPGGGRIAIHGTSDPNDRGRRVSHGCVRVYNDDLRLLKRMPLGTPVIIQR